MSISVVSCEDFDIDRLTVNVTWKGAGTKAEPITSILYKYSDHGKPEKLLLTLPERVCYGLNETFGYDVATKSFKRSGEVQGYTMAYKINSQPPVIRGPSSEEEKIFDTIKDIEKKVIQAITRYPAFEGLRFKELINTPMTLPEGAGPGVKKIRDVKKSDVLYLNCIYYPRKTDKDGRIRKENFRTKFYGYGEEEINYKELISSSDGYVKGRVIPSISFEGVYIKGEQGYIRHKLFDAVYLREENRTSRATRVIQNPNNNEEENEEEKEEVVKDEFSGDYEDQVFGNSSKDTVEKRKEKRRERKKKEKIIE